MATVTTQTASSGQILNWDTPPGVSGYPRGEIVFAGIQTIPLKDAANVSIWELTCTLPRNFVWRLAELRFEAESDAEAVFDDWERGARVRISANAGSFIDDFGCFSSTRVYTQSQNSMPFTVGATNDIFETFETAKLPGYFIDARQDASIVLTWLDVTSDSTAITTARFRIRCFMYTQEDLLNYAIHVPNGVLPG